MARYTISEPDTLPYRYADGEAIENVPRLIPRILNSVPSPPPTHFSSWHAPPSEMGFVPDTSTAGSQTSEQPASFTNMAHDFARHGDHCYGQDFFPPSRGYDSHGPELPSVPSQFSVSPRGAIDPPVPGSTAHSVVYTDDTTVKLTNRIRRQCFNCTSKATTTWRRSMLMSGKWVCNKCGLFERAHATPRPKSFPRRRRSRSPPPSRYPTTDAPRFNHFEYRHYDDRSFTGHFPSVVGSTCSNTNSQDPNWMTDIVSSTPTRLNPTHFVSPQPRAYHAGSHFPYTVPAEAAYPSSGSHISDRRLPM